MRNIFDQYQQPENKLTHALVSTLHHDRRLIPKFLRWLKISSIPPIRQIQLLEQQIPGTQIMDNEDGASGLPDACFYNNDGWAVAVESKVQAKVSFSQIERHSKTLSRFGYENVQVILISVNRPQQKPPDYVTCVKWREIYGWFKRLSVKSLWTQTFTDYMQVFESKMLAQEYQIEGTITMFNGFQFDGNQPYTYHNGKRLIKLLGLEFRKNKKLIHCLHINPGGLGRPAITKGENDSVWDFIPLQASKGAHNFTDYPHITIGLRNGHALAALTIPNGIKGGIKNRLIAFGLKGFQQLITSVEKNTRSVIRKAPGAKPIIYVVQRHYKSQRSSPEIDARLDVDIRTLVQNSELKYQPMWLDAIYGILTNKKTNIQFGVEVHFPYTCPVMQSQKAADVMVDAWVGFKPILDFVLTNRQQVAK